MKKVAYITIIVVIMILLITIVCLLQSKLNKIDDVNSNVEIINGDNINDFSQIDINNYVGEWYQSQDMYGYSSVNIKLDENNNPLVEITIFRLGYFDKLISNLSGNVIDFYGYDYDEGVNGTITLDNNAIILKYNSSLASNMEQLEFTFLVNDSEN